MSAPDAGQRRQELAASPVIKKLRWQFVAACMGLIAIVLAIVFGCVWASAQSALERSSHMALEQALSRRSGDLLPGFHQSGGDDQVLLPYFTVQVWGTTVYVTGGTYSGLEDTDALTAILTDCLAQEEDEGSLPGYALRYLRQDDGLYTQIAFVDISLETAALRQMMASYLRIALLSLILLAGASFLLSLRVTRPVERAWRQQRQFFSDASHELKTPLTVILSNAEMLEGAALPERESRWRDNILSEARQMKTLVEEMLTLSRTEDAQRKPTAADVDLSDLAEDCALAFEPVAFEAGKPLSWDVTPALTVSGDGEKLRRLLSILLDNAAKYGAPGEGIVLSLRAERNQAVLSVSNGSGGHPIPPEELPRLFERFYRTDTSRGEQSGFGLGLPIAQAIAKEHHGALRAESDEKTTRFTFTLPLKK